MSMAGQALLTSGYACHCQQELQMVSAGMSSRQNTQAQCITGLQDGMHSGKQLK